MQLATPRNSDPRPITFILNIYKNKIPYISKLYLEKTNEQQIFVLMVLDCIELIVHYYHHQQDAVSQTEQTGRLFKQRRTLDYVAAKPDHPTT